MSMKQDNKLAAVCMLPVRYSLQYFSYCLLTGLVFFVSAALFVIIIKINPHFSFSFMKYFSFLNPAYSTGTFSGDLGDVMQIYLLISFIVMIIIKLLEFVNNQWFHLKLEIPYANKIKFWSIIILLSAMYITAILIEPRVRIVMVIFFIAAILNYLLYRVVIYINKFVNQYYPRFNN